MNTPACHRRTGAAPTLLAASFALAGIGVSVPAAAVEVEPKARLHLDYARHDADTTPLDDGWIVRRAVIGLEGKFGDDWEFEIGYGLEDDGRLRPRDGGVRDATVTYEGWAAGDLSAGQSKLPFGLEESTSSNDISFIERALPVGAFPLSRRMGLAFTRKRDRYTLSAMAFGSSVDGDDRGRGAAARLAFTPVHTDRTVLHLGVAAVTETPRSKVDFDTGPESRVADEDLVNTGAIDAVDRIDRFGLESAWRSGPYSVQAEWMQAGLQRESGYPDATLDGWYVAASWVLTGQSRPYRHGRFRGIEPGGTAGAWELTARHSRIDLDDADVRGGRERNISVGLNYYPNEHLRVMLNYIRVQSTRRGVSDDPNILLLRMQVTL